MACLQSLEDGILQTILGNNLFDNCSNQRPGGLRSYGGGFGNPSDAQTGATSTYKLYRNGVYECSGLDEREEGKKMQYGPCTSNNSVY